MNRYDLWRFFGYLPEVPETAFTLGPDQALQTLSTDSGSIASLCSIALRFSRLDDLKKILGPDNWEDSADGLLYRSRLRFYRALAENPESPEVGLLEEAASDFRKAAEFPGSYGEASAGLVRIHALLDGTKTAVRHLSLLERRGGRAARPAVAGACLFLADRPGTEVSAVNKFLRKALRNLRHSEQGNEIRLIRPFIEYKLGSMEKARMGWSASAGAGSLESRLMLIRDDIDRWNRSGSTVERDRLLADLSKYKKARPTDPRAFIAEGDLLLSQEPETARLAWRSALVLDDRYADAWKRLGDLYRETWEGSRDEFRGTWLEAANDAYLKAVTLNPLNADFRQALGIAEREAGRPARAIGTLLGGLALSSDSVAIRRWLAVCWTDLAYSSDLSPSARTASAGRARIEWNRILLKGGRHPYDLMGLLRSMVLEAAGDPDKSIETSKLLPLLTDEILRIYPDEDSSDLIGLAEDFLQAGFNEYAGRLLDRASENQPEHPGLLAARGLLTETISPSESLIFYMKAASSVETGTSEKNDWLLRASEMADRSGNADLAETILGSAISDDPGNQILVKNLADKMVSRGKVKDAAALYRNALSSNSGNPDLLEDVVWFLRDAGMPDSAEKLLRDAIHKNPEDSRLWNQLGVHFMETGWDDQSDEMKKEVLKEAVKAYRHALDIYPESTVFLGNLGDALRQSGRLSEAEELLKRAVDDGGDATEDAFAVNSLARLEDERSYNAGGNGGSILDWENSGTHYLLAAEIGDKNADYQRDYAWWLYRERRLEDSIIYYRKASYLDPTNDALPYGESICRMELGDEEAARNALERALSLNPSEPGMMADMADILGRSGEVDKAEEMYRDLISQNPNAAWVWRRLAEFREMRAEEAEPGPDAPLLSLDGPGDVDIDRILNTGGSPEGDRWRRLALKAWTKALENNPGNRSLRVRCGAAWMAVGRRDKAGELISASAFISREPGDPDSLNRLGRYELAEAVKRSSPGLWEISKTHLVAAIESAPLEASFHADLGLWYYLGSQWENALEAFRQASDRDPANPDFAANTGICAVASGSYDEGIAYLNRALSLRDTDAEWHNALGICLLASGHPELALESFRSACLKDPRSLVYTANLAMAHESLHTPEGPIQ